MRLPALCLMLTASVVACGRSGSHPRFFPEVRFQIEPLGGQQGTTFAVDFIASGSARHHFEAGRTFTVTEPFGFYLENAAPPYWASFSWVSGAAADVVLIVSGRTVQIAPVPLGPPNPSVQLMSARADPNDLAESPGNPEVRLEVSAVPGTLFQGTIGDFFFSYDVGRTSDPSERVQPRAPAIIFFQNARETISAVFRNANEIEITIDLYIDGILRASDTSRKDAVVKHDL